MKTTKTISRTTYLQVLGLLSLGHHHSMKAYEFEAGLKDMLDMTDDIGSGFCHLTDEMYSTKTAPDFEEAINRAGIVVEDTK